jgi:hypothetical protein
MKQRFDIQFVVIENLLLLSDYAEDTDIFARERSGSASERVDGTGTTQTLKIVLAAGL